MIDIVANFFTAIIELLQNGASGLLDAIVGVFQ